TGANGFSRNGLVDRASKRVRWRRLLKEPAWKRREATTIRRWWSACKTRMAPSRYVVRRPPNDLSSVCRLHRGLSVGRATDRRALRLRPSSPDLHKLREVSFGLQSRRRARQGRVRGYHSRPAGRCAGRPRQSDSRIEALKRFQCSRHLRPVPKFTAIVVTLMAALGAGAGLSAQTTGTPVPI